MPQYTKHFEYENAFFNVLVNANHQGSSSGERWHEVTISVRERHSSVDIFSETKNLSCYGFPSKLNEFIDSAKSTFLDLARQNLDSYFQTLGFTLCEPTRGGELTVTQGRMYRLEERIHIWFTERKPNRDVVDDFDELDNEKKREYLDILDIPKFNMISGTSGNSKDKQNKDKQLNDLYEGL